MHLASSPSFLSVCASWQSAFVNSHFEDWSLNCQVAGRVKSGGRMTFVAVEAADHMVPVDQPQVVKQQNVAMFKIISLLS